MRGKTRFGAFGVMEGWSSDVVEADESTMAGRETPSSSESSADTTCDVFLGFDCGLEGRETGAILGDAPEDASVISELWDCFETGREVDRPELGRRSVFELLGLVVEEEEGKASSAEEMEMTDLSKVEDFLATSSSRRGVVGLLETLVKKSVTFLFACASNFGLGIFFFERLRRESRNALQQRGRPTKDFRCRGSHS